jgi:hypothetical protein
MANSLHVAKLAEGARAWNVWRADNPAVVPDLSGLELSAGRLQLGPAQGGPVNLSGADLGGATLEQATLIGANLAGASLMAADLSNARLEGADLGGANLTHANLDQADLRDARLDGATLSGAQLAQARNLTQAQLEGAVGDEHAALPAGLVRPTGWHKAPAQLARSPHRQRKGRAGDPHSVLGVGRRASRQEIRAAYLRLAKELHPDGRLADPVAAERMKEINDAYQELKGYGGRAEARRSEARRSRAVFVVGALSAMLPLLLAGLAWLYLAGSPGGREETARRPAPDTVGTSTLAKRPTGAAARQEAAWAEAERAGTREAWRRYLEAYPDGLRAEKARQAIAAIEAAEAAEARRRAEVAAWAAAEKSASRKGWQRYLEAYPNSERAAEARQAIAAIDAAEARRLAELEARRRAEVAAWAAAEESASREGWQRYLEAHPDGGRVAEARQAIAALEAAEASRRAELEARRRAEQAAWAAAEKSASREGWRRYLEAHSDGERAAEARQAIAAIEAAEAAEARRQAELEARRRVEVAAWAAAEKSASREGWLRYLEAHPDGARAAEARQAMAAIEAAEAAEARRRGERAAWAAAAKSGAREDLERYLIDYPSGSRVGEAQERLTALDIKEAERDDAAWFKAKRRNSKASYAGYLTNHPTGRYARDARLRVAELERAETKAAPPVTPVKTPPIAKSPDPEPAGSQRWPAADEPFIGADGRIRR